METSEWTGRTGKSNQPPASRNLVSGRPPWKGGGGGGGEARFVDCHSHNTHLGIASESEAAFGVGAWDGMGADFKGIGKIAGVGMGDSKT